MFSNLFGPKAVTNPKWTSEEMKELEHEFDSTTKLYESILPAMKAMQQSQLTMVKKLHEFSDAMSKHGTEEKYPLSKVFEKSAIAHKGLSETQAAFLKRYETSVIQPVEAFIENDIKQTKAKRKDYRAEVAKYETKEQNVAKLETGGPEKVEKLKVAQAELQAQQTKCEGLRDSLLQSYRQVTQKKRLELTTLMRELGMMQLENFDSCQRVLDQPHRDIEALSVDVFTSTSSTPSKAPSLKTSIAQATNNTQGQSNNPFLEEDKLTPRGDEE
eukprot:c15877_g1_i1.p1 GENE.c15877_g1_i1~~c15877_g1_i1.p1  ORF type:complete len:272 (-),score=79.09 c15877_g1_i1:122-937(-)